MSQFPKGLVLGDSNGTKHFTFSRLEAYAHMKTNVIDVWSPQREVLALRIGPALMAIGGVITGYEVQRKVRNLHGLGRVRAGFWAASFATTVISSIATVSSQTYLVGLDIMLGSTQCPVCVQTRSASMLMVTGVALPSLMACLSTAMQAQTMNVSKELPTGVAGSLRWLGKMLAKNRGVIATSAVLQMGLGLLIVSRMQWEILHVSSELEKFDAILKEKEKKRTIIDR